MSRAPNEWEEWEIEDHVWTEHGLFPQTINEFKKSWLFGLVTIDYIVEDRRPDLKEYAHKYKHLITVKVKGVLNIGWVLHTDTPCDGQPFVSRR